MLKLILLPGMDGTGKLFEPLLQELGSTFNIQTLSYAADICLSYSELLPLLQSTLPPSGPFVLLAESFSTPLAAMLAAENPPNLKAIVLCAGFITSPIEGWRRPVYSLLAPTIFANKLPDIAAKHFLLGANAPPSLLRAVQAAIASVKPAVLSARLRTILACDVRAELTLVAVPILYLQAKQDRLIASSSLEEIRRILPQTMVEKIAGPHLLLQREPQSSADAIKRFIRQLPR